MNLGPYGVPGFYTGDCRFGDFKSGFNKLYQQARIEKGAR